MNEFGAYLTYARTRAGFQSLGEAARAARSLEGGTEGLSKVRLSLYERGAVNTLTPETLRSLAQLYGLRYEELAQRWFADRYQVQLQANPQPLGLSASATQEYLLEDPRSGEQATIIDVPALERLQAKLPVGSQVAVAALRFLDDTVFFDMVSRNLQRGIIYYYVLPESQRITYEHLLSRVGKKYPSLRDRLDGQRTFFIARPDDQIPFNGVVFLLPTGEIQGYIGLLSDDQPAFFQVAKDRLAMRCFVGLRALIRAGRIRTSKRRSGRQVSGTNTASKTPLSFD